MRVVAFRKGLKNPLLLFHITWDNNIIQSASVINGGWDFSRVDGVLCVGGDTNSSMEEFEKVIVIPIGLVGDYNDLIIWAEHEATKPNPFREGVLVEIRE